MTHSKLDLFAPIDWRTKLIGSPRRCHTIGGVLSLILLVGIGWLSFRRERLNTNSDYTTDQVAEATRLVSQWDQWRDRMNLATAEQSSLNNEIDEIKKWLPQRLQWSDVRSAISDIARRCNLEIISLRRKQGFDGSRIAVLKSSVQINGSYRNVCRFLDQLSRQDQPIWCDEIDLTPDHALETRLEDNSSQMTTSEITLPETKCTATLSLRVPFVGQGTAAQRLLGDSVEQAGDSNAI